MKQKAQRAAHKRGRPGLIRHMSGHGVKVEGEGQIFKYVHTSLKVSFLPFKTSSFNHANIRSPELQ